MTDRTFPPKIGQEVAWRYGHGYARGTVVSTGVTPRSGREFAIVEWSSRSRVKRIRRDLSDLIWPHTVFGPPFAAPGVRPR